MRKRTYKSKTTRDIRADEPRPSRPIDAEKARAKTMKRAINLLAAKPRSVNEMRERLLEKEWTNEETVEAVIAKLKEYGYVDDERFAYGFASSRVRQKPLGRGRLLRDLQMKKVDRETASEAIRQVFEETPEEDLIDRAIGKRVRLRGLPQTRAETKSLFDHLLRQGFSYDLVIRRVRAATNASIDETDEAAIE
ncbi:MAG: regulatory protein RecX [Pyrinomonadaceae bacterium]